MRSTVGSVKRLLALGAALTLLSGCALPPAIAIASYVIDVGSFVATGKTATDHGLSAVMQQDCAMMGILQGQICKDDPNYELADAGVLQPLEPTGPQAILPPAMQPEAKIETASRANDLQVASAAPVTSFAPPTTYAPVAITPLARGGDLQALPNIELLPNAQFLSDQVWLAGTTVTRDGLLGGASYLADGLVKPLSGNGG